MGSEKNVERMHARPAACAHASLGCVLAGSISSPTNTTTKPMMTTNATTSRPDVAHSRGSKRGGGRGSARGTRGKGRRDIRYSSTRSSRRCRRARQCRGLQLAVPRRAPLVCQEVLVALVSLAEPDPSSPLSVRFHAAITWDSSPNFFSECGDLTSVVLTSEDLVRCAASGLPHCIAKH